MEIHARRGWRRLSSLDSSFIREVGLTQDLAGKLLVELRELERAGDRGDDSACKGTSRSETSQGVDVWVAVRCIRHNQSALSGRTLYPGIRSVFGLLVKAE